MTTNRKYLVYFTLGRVRFGIRWPTGWRFPTKYDLVLALTAFVIGLLIATALMGCATSGKPLDVVTDREGREHRVLHSEFGAGVLP